MFRYESMLPLEAAVTLAMKALCLAANSGLLNLDERLALPSLTSDRGDSEPVGVGGPAVVPDTEDDVRARKLLRLFESTRSIFSLF